MINGVVNTHLEGTIRLLVHGPTGQQLEVEAIIDTGLTGTLTLPPAVIASLGLVWCSRGAARMANGRVEQFDIHEATVTWDGAQRNLLAEAAVTDVLVGMQLLAGYALRIQVRVGGSVEIEVLP